MLKSSNLRILHYIELFIWYIRKILREILHMIFPNFLIVIFFHKIYSDKSSPPSYSSRSLPPAHPFSSITFLFFSLKNKQTSQSKIKQTEIKVHEKHAHPYTNTPTLHRNTKSKTLMYKKRPVRFKSAQNKAL